MALHLICTVLTEPRLTFRFCLLTSLSFHTYEFSGPFYSSSYWSSVAFNTVDNSGNCSLASLLSFGFSLSFGFLSFIHSFFLPLDCFSSLFTSCHLFYHCPAPHHRHLLSLSLSLFFFFFLGPHPWHMEVPRVGIELELLPQAYTTATPMSDLSYHRSRQCWILNPLRELRGGTGNLMITSQIVSAESGGNSHHHLLWMYYRSLCLDLSVHILIALQSLFHTAAREKCISSLDMRLSGF